MTSKDIFELLLKRGETIGFAESMTGGLASYQIVENPGASRVLMGSLVTYATSVKYDLLGINARFIEAHGIVSEPVAKAMAESVRMELGATIGVGITGDAGPSMQEGSTFRQAFVAVTNGKETLVEALKFENETRKEAITLTVSFAYNLIEKLLLKN